MVGRIASGIVDAILAVRGEWTLFLGIVCRQVMWGGRFVVFFVVIACAHAWLVSAWIEPSFELL